jgi:RNA polymerase-binding protein DksA
MSEVDRTLNTMQDESTALPDVNDRATQEEEFAIELRTRDRERKLIRKIEQSLEAIKNEDYGFCETCGIEIGLRRLEARPTATLCIDCKTLAEIKESKITVNCDGCEFKTHCFRISPPCIGGIRCRFNYLDNNKSLCLISDGLHPLLLALYILVLY